MTANASRIYSALSPEFGNSPIAHSAIMIGFLGSSRAISWYGQSTRPKIGPRLVVELLAVNAEAQPVDVLGARIVGGREIPGIHRKGVIIRLEHPLNVARATCPNRSTREVRSDHSLGAAARWRRTRTERLLGRNPTTFICAVISVSLRGMNFYPRPRLTDRT